MRADAHVPAWVRETILTACERANESQRVVVIADAQIEDDALTVLRRVRAARTLLVVKTNAARRRSDGVSVRYAGKGHGPHQHLSRMGQVDVIVDLRDGNARSCLRRWRSLFFHLSDGGTHAIPTATLSGPADVVTALSAWEELASLPDQTPLLPPRHRRAKVRLRRRELARAVGTVEQRGGTLLVTKQHTHLLKLRERGVVPLLNHRGTGLHASVVDRHDGGVLRPDRVHTSWPAGEAMLLDEIPYPPAVLRHYEGEVGLLDGVIAHHGNTVLPESFRWPFGRDLSNDRLFEVGPHFARFAPDMPPYVDLEGSFYYFDYKNLGHYGHLLTEAVSKLWGWERARERDPDIKLLLRVRTRPGPQRPRIDREVLGAFGIEEKDVVWVDRPVRVRSLVGATPLLQAKEPYHAHPLLSGVWGRIRSGLLAQVDPAAPPGPRRIFVTRHGGNRSCRNVDEVERMFEDAGFAIVLPENLSLPQQAALFGGADVVAGFGGSGMFNLLYTSGSPEVIVLNHHAYDARNEHLITAVTGSDVHYFWSPSDTRPQRGSMYKAFQSSWRFDFDANGDALQRLLDRVGTSRDR